MAAEQKHAPRVAREGMSAFSVHPRLNASSAHVEHLTKFKMNDMHPFYSDAQDIAHKSLTEAHALALMLGSAFADSENTATTNPFIIENAFGAISTLVALAYFSLTGAPMHAVDEA